MGSLTDVARSMGLVQAASNGLEAANGVAASENEQPEENKDLDHLEAILLKLICDGKFFLKIY